MTNQSLTISKNESSMLSLLRVLAMGSIVVCHILQTLDNNWAWVFNIGVQVFLVLSGYLYGHKVIDKWIPWFVARLKKLYIPYIIYVLFFLALYKITGFQQVSIKSVLVYVFGIQGLVGGGGIKCLGHLWFMTAIAMCYMITPILQRLSKYSVFCVISLFAICIVEYYVYPLRLNIFSWLFLYSIGYLLPKLNLCGRLCVLLLSLGMLAYALVGISWADIRGGSVEGTILHNCAGILVVCLLSFIGKRMKFSIECGLLLFLDASSYYVYIVHVPFVRPPFDVLHITEFMPLNIAFAIILIFISAFILEKLTKKLTSYIPSFVQ